MLVMKITLPIQSTVLSFSRRSPGGLERLPRKKIAIGRAIPQVGRLSQKHHLQVARSTNSPPMSGPRRLPTAQAPRTIVKYFGLCRSGTRSAKMICDKAMIPAPPIPCTTRPTSINMKSLAMPHKTEPKAKRNIEGTRSSRRPKISDNVARKGCNTACDSRYAVPVQKVSIAVPLSSTARVGRTGTRIVASNATTSDETAQVINIQSSFVVGLHIGSDNFKEEFSEVQDDMLTSTSFLESIFLQG